MRTPKTLTEAMRNALTEPTTERQSWHIRDFMAQKFCLAIHEAKTEAEQKRLHELFKMLTAVEKPERKIV